MKYLTVTALIYGALWLLSLLSGNYLILVIQSFIGAGLFLAIALYLNTIDDENLTSHLKLEQEIKRLSEELEDFKKNKS
jgi:hypothetical protein